MRSAYYNIHGLVDFEVRGISNFALRDMNRPFSYFEQPWPSKTPDISVEMGPFFPDLKNAFSVDQRYFARKNYLFFRESNKGLGWTAEIEGIEREKTRMKYWSSVWNRFRWPWTFFPDLAFYNYILQPFLEKKLLQKNCFLLHSGAIVRDGRAILLIGRGQVYKTTFVLRLLREGFEVLGDDFILIKKNQAYSFPASPLFLEFAYRYLRDERFQLFDQFRLAVFLSRERKSSLHFAHSAAIEKAYLLMSSDEDADSSHFKNLSQEDKIEMIVLNQLLERSAYMGYRYQSGQFLDAYHYAFPNEDGRSFESDLRHQVRCTFQSIPIEPVLVPRDLKDSDNERILSRIKG